MPSSLRPKSLVRSEISWARARSISVNVASVSRGSGCSHPAEIQLFHSTWSIPARSTKSRVGIMSNLETCSQIVRGCGLPSVHELIQFGIGPYRQHDVKRDKLVALRVTGIALDMPGQCDQAIARGDANMGSLDTRFPFQLVKYALLQALISRVLLHSLQLQARLSQLSVPYRRLGNYSVLFAHF